MLKLNEKRNAYRHTGVDTDMYDIYILLYFTQFIQTASHRILPDDMERGLIFFKANIWEIIYLVSKILLFVME